MQVHYGFEHTDTIRRPIATVGSYDGIHYGHRAILDRLNELAREDTAKVPSSRSTRIREP